MIIEILVSNEADAMLSRSGFKGHSSFAFFNLIVVIAVALLMFFQFVTLIVSMSWVREALFFARTMNILPYRLGHICQRRSDFVVSCGRSWSRAC